MINKDVERPQNLDNNQNIKMKDIFNRLKYRAFGQKKEIKGRVGRSSEHRIEIWNRTWNLVLKRVFYDENWRNHSAYLDLLNHRIKVFFQGSLKNERTWYSYYSYTTEKTEENVDIGLDQIFKEGNIVVDLGCGFGAAAYGMASMHPNVKIIGGDYELGKKIPIPKYRLKNLEYRNIDWRNINLPDNSVDAWISDQGVGKYGNDAETVQELTRVSKPGTVLRATIESRVVLGEKKFTDRLIENGWEVYYIVTNTQTKSKINTRLICAKLVNKTIIE